MKSQNASITSIKREDVYTRVTNSIIAALEQGVRPWTQPWNAEHSAGRITRPLRHNGTPYRGINVLMLWSAAVEKGFISPLWVTYKQALELGAHVRKGENGSTVVYADRITRTDTNDKGEEVEEKIPFLKAYTVFNAGQIDGLPERFYTSLADLLPVSERIEAAERFVATTGAQISNYGNMAFYAPGPDRIQLPGFEFFKDAESYYATALHELTHWTRHKTRLDRDFGRKEFGDEGYAREELVAELGAAFLCADLKITPEPREDHAAYIGHWLKALREDKRAIFSAAAHAQKASDFLHGLQQQEVAHA